MKPYHWILLITLIALTFIASTFAPPKYPMPTHEPKVNLNQPSIDYWNLMQGGFVVIEAKEVKSK